MALSGIKLVSGGQTGADRAALDFAIEHDIPHGGWCPRGHRAEDGIIPPRFLLRETPSIGYSQRTEWNVRDSDATVIFTIVHRLQGGSATTTRFARKYGKPCLHLAAERPGVGFDAFVTAYDEVGSCAVVLINANDNSQAEQRVVEAITKQ